jgi:protein SCO1/2
MQPVRQNSEVKIQTRSGRGRAIWRTALAVCILHSAFGMTGVTLSAQQQPGMPGSMGMTGGIVSSNVPEKFREVTFSQRLGERLPLDARLKDEQGQVVTLGDYFGRKPVVLAFVYYQCPMLCPLVMNGISSALKVVPFTAGSEFDVVLVSFDPKDTPEAANAKKVAHLQHWAATDTAAGWHFLTGEDAEVRRIASAAGFTYQWDEATQQFAHVSGLLVATPDGRLSRYFYGVEYSPKDLRLALVDSSQGKLGSVVDELLLYCFHYDPSSGRYGAVFMNIMRLGGVLTVGLIVGFIVLMRWRESRHVAERHA